MQKFKKNTSAFKMKSPLKSYKDKSRLGPKQSYQEKISNRRQAMLDKKADLKTQMQKDFYGV